MGRWVVGRVSGWVDPLKGGWVGRRPPIHGHVRKIVNVRLTLRGQQQYKKLTGLRRGHQVLQIAFGSEASSATQRFDG